MGSAEVTIFWFVPVALLVIFIVLVLSHSNAPQRRKLLFFEPLGTLITSWRAVRFLGTTSELERTLTEFLAAQPSDQSALDHIRLAEKPHQSSTTLLERKDLGALTEQRVIGHGGQTISIVAGDCASVLKTCRYRSDGRTLLTESDLFELGLTAQRAGEHGYLALGLSRRHFHSRIIEADKHTWLGLVFLEPVIEEGILKRLRAITPNRLKLLSVLPNELLGFLNQKLGHQSELDGIPKKTLPTPADREAFWEQSRAIGLATFEERHAVVRYFGPRRDCRMVSALSTDRELPVKISPTF